MKNYFMRFPQSKTKAVTLSYDDGCRADIRLCQTISKYGLKCTFNINSQGMGDSPDAPRLMEEEIREHLIASGHEIAVHGAMHKALGSVYPADGIRDVLEGRAGLERKFGGIIKGLAYANSGIRIMENGATYQDVRNYLIQLGISYARTLGGDNNNFWLPSDWYAWMPTAHHQNPKLFEYIDEFLKIDVDSALAGAKRPILFYLWGHAYEFDRNDNWDRLEEICQKLSANPDIWYATNIEICNYTKAYHSLEYNIDQTLVYNPTLYDIWFWADGKDYCIKSGETMKL